MEAATEATESIYSRYEEFIMIINGRLTEIFVNIDPKLYRKFVVLDKGMKVLYVKLKKALYGLLRGSLLFYLKLATELKNNGFIIHTYEPCVANKLVKG